MSCEIFYQDATGLAESIREKRISPVEVMVACLERIEAVNPNINAMITLVADRALDAARSAERQVMREDHLPPLHGVPFTVKDSFDTAAVKTTRGSRLFLDNAPIHDATAVSRLRRAGGILLGKTNVPEFSFWTETDNLIVGRTANPWRLERSAGGSSGGEAAAVASGMSPLGVASDVAISIRGPASFCGIVGLKPTHGRVPLTGHWPPILNRFWCPGPLARSVRDNALALSLLAGPDWHDGYAVPTPPFVHCDSRPDSDWRIGRIADAAFGPVDPAVSEAVEAAARILESECYRVETVEIPELESLDWNVLSATLFLAEAKPYFDRLVAGREADIHPNIKRLMSQPDVSLDAYLAAQRDVERLRRAFIALFRDYDAFICPVVPIAAPSPGLSEYVVAGLTVPYRHVVRATVPFNLIGLPALSVPVRQSGDGLPIGVQIVAQWLCEDVILRIGAMLELHIGQSTRHPPL